MQEAAYELEYFPAKTNEEHDRELKRRAFNIVHAKRQVKKVAPIKLLAIGIAVVLVSSLMIYSRVVLTELTEDANSYQTKITKLNTEYDRLEAELEAKTSIKTIAEAAENDLGLSKIDSSQIEYVRLTDLDEIVVDSGEDVKVTSFIDSLFQKLSDIIF